MSERRSASTAARGPKLTALAALVIVGGGWIVYSHAWRDGDAGPLPYRDVTSKLRGLRPARGADRVFVAAQQLAHYIRFADPGYTRGLPQIDFHHDEALLVTTGPRSSTGYSIRTVSATEERGRAVVTVREQTPSPRTPGRPQLTYPYRLLVFHKLDKPVYIVWQGRP